MEIAIFALFFVTALLLAGVMGYAVQRGATCTVAAVDQLLNQGSAQRFMSILEAAMWVTLGLFVARVLGLSMNLPGGYPASAATVAGGALLGVGAYVNRACVFGAIARLGSGEWSYLLTPLGFYLGYLFMHKVFGYSSSAMLPYAEPSMRISIAIALLLSVGLIWRSSVALRHRLALGASSGDTGWSRMLIQHLWQPTAATCIIGISFVGMLLLVGAWAYTDVIADLASGNHMSLLARGLLLLALFAGALLGGYRTGRFHRSGFSRVGLLRCSGGGALMGAGSSLIPGGNDGLLLVGMPLLWPYAWVAFAAMLATIVLAMRLQRWTVTAR